MAAASLGAGPEIPRPGPRGGGQCPQLADSCEGILAAGNVLEAITGGKLRDHLVVTVRDSRTVATSAE